MNDGNNFLEYFAMKSWWHLFFSLLCLIGAFVCVSPVLGEDSGFQKYRENVLQQIEEIKAEIEKNPEDAKAHFQLGLTYMALGRHEEEVREYLEAVRLEPDFADAHFNLGLSYDLSEDGASAIQHMLRAQQIYSAKRNHRGVRTSQRYLRTFYSKYGVVPEVPSRRK